MTAHSPDYLVSLTPIYIINNINEINKYFKSLDNRSKLVWLMSTEDSTIIKKTGRLLLDLHTKRNLRHYDFNDYQINL
jgi:hypothetical protein